MNDSGGNVRSPKRKQLWPPGSLWWHNWWRSTLVTALPKSFLPCSLSSDFLGGEGTVCPHPNTHLAQGIVAYPSPRAQAHGLWYYWLRSGLGTQYWPRRFEGSSPVEVLGKVLTPKKLSRDFVFSVDIVLCGSDAWNCHGSYCEGRAGTVTVQSRKIENTWPLRTRGAAGSAQCEPRCSRLLDRQPNVFLKAFPTCTFSKASLMIHRREGYTSTYTSNFMKLAYKKMRKVIIQVSQN